MANLYWMIGISGSGKSTLAKRLSFERKAEIVSSDKIRAELYGDENIQGDPNEVFRLVHERIFTYLRVGYDVIYDATNISLKNRRKFFKFLESKYIDAKHIAVVMTTPLNICINNNNSRERVVPEHVIMKQYKSFNIPFFEEGFDEIILDGWFDNKPITKYNTDFFDDFNYHNLLAVMDSMIYFDQKNPHHNATLGYHCINVYNKIKEYSDDKSLLYASLLHDVGKLYTQEIDNDGIAHYFNHGNVGCYSLLQNIDVFGLSPSEIINALFYINYHMLPFNWELAKTKDKYNKIFGNEKFNNLMLLNKIDRECSID